MIAAEAAKAEIGAAKPLANADNAHEVTRASVEQVPWRADPVLCGGPWRCVLHHRCLARIKITVACLQKLTRSHPGKYGSR